MGHCDSSAQLGRDGGIFGVAGGAIEGHAADHAHSCGCDHSGGQFQAAQLKLAATESKTQARSASRWLLLAFVRFYKIFFSPFLGGACKFYPSCSNYAQEAIELHGARRGAWLAIKRLGRCRPFTQGGFDPVPDAEELDPAWLRSVAHFQNDIESKEQAQ
jgi:uncharacterized protein